MRVDYIKDISTLCKISLLFHALQIIHNPPFVGYKLQSEEQKNDLRLLFGDVKTIDYVAGWYLKSAGFIKNTDIKVAFVSTNSITQGEQVPALWKRMICDYGVSINFAYRTFVWDSEASDKANVHCVIVGFGQGEANPKKIVDGKSTIMARHINPYLVDADDVFIEKRNNPICDAEIMVYGSEPREGGYLILSEAERKELIEETPECAELIRRFVSSEDYINNKIRYCLWIEPNKLHIARKSSIIMTRLNGCREFREHSKQAQAHAASATPYMFSSPRQPTTDYLLIPVVSSANRRYIPIGYMSKEVVPSNACFTISNASLYTFGIIVSNVHMSWVRAVCGRLKSDYRYSNTIVYNNFPWPMPDENQKKAIIDAAEKILKVRESYPTLTLADLYDPLTMPPDLAKAHQTNDAAVMRAYGMPIKDTDEAACVAWLMRLYQEKTASA